MNAQNVYKFSAVASIVMVLLAAVMTLMMIWGDPLGIAFKTEVWGTIATLFATSIVVFAITREMVRVAKAKAPADDPPTEE
jgi:hypothetical protein